MSPATRLPKPHRTKTKTKRNTMANFSSHFCALSLLAILFAGLAIPTRSDNTLFVFGDSLFDAGINQYIEGNTQFAQYHYPYGETFFKHPTGRYSDGRVVPDFIAILANLPMLPPYLQPGEHNFIHGANFASGGGRVLGGQEHGSPLNLGAQLSMYKNVVKELKQKLGVVEAKKVLKRAVYLFSLGGNDYFRFSSQQEGASEQQQIEYTADVLGNLTAGLKEIYALGGRKIAFQNVGPLGCTPSSRPLNSTEQCFQFGLTMARRHNRLLPVALKKLESELPGFKYSIFDYYHALYARIIYPSKFGLKVGDSACCGVEEYRRSSCGGNKGTIPYELCDNPFEYVWWDGAHTTEEANKQLAELIWNGNPKITGPYTVKQLFESL